MIANPRVVSHGLVTEHPSGTLAILRDTLVAPSLHSPPSNIQKGRGGKISLRSSSNSIVHSREFTQSRATSGGARKEPTRKYVDGATQLACTMVFPASAGQALHRSSRPAAASPN